MFVLRQCGKCGEAKDLDDFAWRRRGRNQRDNMCRSCRSAYGKQHYEANKQHYIATNARRKHAVTEERWTYLIEYFRSNPCADCGETDPLVLEFDHLGLEAKSFNISQGLRDRRWEDVLAEIGKCDVVCANCHRRRTVMRGGFVRAAVAQR